MRITAVRSFTLLSLAAALACNGDSATGVAAPSAGKSPTTATKLSAPIQTTTLVRNTPLPATVTASKVIGAAGGSFTLPGTGLTITVARNAVAGNTTFSATAYAGAAIGYDFAPHQTFNAAITLTQDFSSTNALDVIRAGGVPQVAYFADRSAVDWTTGVASVSELVPTNIDVAGSRVSADVFHFSGYLMSSGRK